MVVKRDRCVGSISEFGGREINPASQRGAQEVKNDDNFHAIKSPEAAVILINRFHIRS